MTRQQSLRSDDRGVSTAVTHVLAIGITAILISGLIAAAAGLLSDQRQNAARTELQTIGNRIANQIAEADRIVNTSDGGPENVRITVEQPNRVAGQTYTGFLREGECNAANSKQPSSDATNWCVVLLHDEVQNETIEVPVEVGTDVQSGAGCIEMAATGGGTFIINATDSSPPCDP